MSSTNGKGLAEERLARIGEIVGRLRIVSVGDLCDQLGASPATIRRDLVALERRGILRRVHGGAVDVEGRLEEPVFDDKAAAAAREKQRIAKAALKLVKPNDSIFLDGGSTVLALARLLGAMNGLTAVTNSLGVMNLFAGSGPRTILVGGEYRRLSQTFVGSLADPVMDQLHVDTAFMGTIGLCSEKGMTTTDAREAHTKERVMAQARQVVLLADSSKIGKVSFMGFGSLADVDLLITDRKAAPKDIRQFRKQKIKVITA